MANAWFPTKDTKSVNLTDFGREQSVALADAWGYPIENIIHSEYDRTLYTAEPLIAKYPNAIVTKSDLIHEFTFLDQWIFANTTPEDRKPFREEFWRNDVDYRDSLASESFADFVARARKFAHQLRNNIPDNTAIFSHEQFITMLIYILESGDDLKPLDQIKRDMHDVFYIHKKWIKNTQVVNLDKYL